MEWWNWHPMPAPLPRGFMDDDTSHKETKEWMDRATNYINELHEKIENLQKEVDDLKSD